MCAGSVSACAYYSHTSTGVNPVSCSQQPGPPWADHNFRRRRERFPQPPRFRFRQTSQRVSLHHWQDAQSGQLCFLSEESPSSGTQICPTTPGMWMNGIVPSYQSGDPTIPETGICPNMTSSMGRSRLSPTTKTESASTRPAGMFQSQSRFTYGSLITSPLIISFPF